MRLVCALPYFLARIINDSNNALIGMIRLISAMKHTEMQAQCQCIIDLSETCNRSNPGTGNQPCMMIALTELSVRDGLVSLPPDHSPLAFPAHGPSAGLNAELARPHTGRLPTFRQSSAPRSWVPSKQDDREAWEHGHGAGRERPGAK